MPFTFSHPAIMIPFLGKRRKIFSATGLIVGSMAPDFESFIRINEHKIYGHTWTGMFWFDMPLGIFLAIIFHNIVRDPLIVNLPDFLKNKFVRFTGFQWNTYTLRHFFVFVTSLLLGIFMHLVWDAFTHLNLADPDAIDSPVYIGHVQLFKILQDTDSLLGILILIWYTLKIPATKPEEIQPEKMIFAIQPRETTITDKLKYWILVFAIAIATVFMALNFSKQQLTFVLAIDMVITGGLVGLVVASLIQKLAIR